MVCFINLAGKLAVLEHPIAAKAKILVAEKFRGLWMQTRGHLMCLKQWLTQSLRKQLGMKDGLLLETQSILMQTK